MGAETRRWGVLTGAAIALLACAAVWAAVPQNGMIGPGDWQYKELDALGRAGLLSGHPQGPLSAWTQGLTRFEAASLVMRAVEGVGEAYQEQGKSLVQVAKAEAGEKTALPAGVTFEDLARVEKLIEEFRAELVAMGVRVDDLSTALKDVQKRLTKVEAEQQKHHFKGYIQVQYRSDQAADKREFLVRRARIKFEGEVDKRTSYEVQLQMDAKEKGLAKGTKTQVRNVFVDYKLNRGRLRIGQAKIPWGYDLQRSSTIRWTSPVGRAFFLDRLFPNARDIGVQWEYRRSPNAPKFDVGVFNGTGMNKSDNNDKKNVMARVDFPVSCGSVAVSAYTGEDGSGAAATDQNRYGVSAHFKWSDTEFLSEYVQGDDRGADVRGWYAQVGHPLTKRAPNLIFAKYDQYDENTDLANDLFKRWSLGYWYELDKHNRLTVLWEHRSPEPGFSEYSKWDGNAYYVQWQTKF